MTLFPQTVSCHCGQVKYQAIARPIVTAVCYCVDCQAAAGLFENFEDVKPYCEPDGGTPYVTLRDKDWVVIEGENLLEPMKLKTNSPTTRYITKCCRSPIFLKYKNGFWTSTYRTRFENPPQLEWRNKVSARQSELPYADDIPRFNGYPLRLFMRLLKARF